MIRIRLATCRHCKEMKSRRLLDLFDRCCSRECLDLVGPCVVTNTNNIQPITIPINRKSKKNKSLRREANSRRSSSRKPRDKRGSFYYTREWVELRYAVLKRYGPTCMLCRRTGTSMHVNHIVPRSKDKSLELEFNNLQVLCRDCNNGKRNYDCNDYRPKELIPDETLYYKSMFDKK